LLESRYAQSIARSYALYRVGKGALPRLADALRQFDDEQPRYAVIEIVDSGVYTEPLRVELQAWQSLQLRAANGARPVLRLLDYMADQPDAFAVSGHADSRFVLDGLLVAGRGIRIGVPVSARSADDDLCEVVVRHCTLVPGWSLDCDCEPKRPSEPSIESLQSHATLRIEHSIIGPIEVGVDTMGADPVDIRISDSIVDATRCGRVALGAPDNRLAFATTTVRRTTVFGAWRTHAIALGENALFMGCVTVARRQTGCMRFCYVSPASRTPRRYRCQPDLVHAALTSTGAQRDADAARETLRVRPRFNSMRYGMPAYGQLAADCAPEIAGGADDESEMGAFHDLFQPQRRANLRARLDEYSPAVIQSGILLAS
jgi:hypothetical protein